MNLSGLSAIADAGVLDPVPLGGLENFVESIGRYPGGNLSFLYQNDGLDLAIVSAYFAILVFLAIYGGYRLRIVYQFWRYVDRKPEPAARFLDSGLPRITVQLPLFNEMYVAERIIDACAALDYPADRLEIQVLDDSTDETRVVVASAVERHRAAGVSIVHLHREDRTGFKAGALEKGLGVATGELVAVFDADFVPRPDCLRRMVDHFTDDRVGMVQMRWSHINRDYSLLTKVQSIMLDGHFVVEQAARNRSGAFFNFNGTAGMWRREAIEWSGGWQHDTLTEDTDLSFRAQLCGWRFVYLLDDDVPSELPVEMNAFKAQQRRWAKGLIEVAIKLMPRVWRDPRLTLSQRFELFFRLTGNISAPLIIVMALLNLPVLIVRYNQGLFQLLVFDAPILLFSTLSVALFYAAGQVYLDPKGWPKRMRYLPLVMAIGIGMSFSNAKAVIEALLGIKTSFVRTPKYRIESSGDASWRKKGYKRSRGLLPVLELGFAAYFLGLIVYAAAFGILGTIPFFLLFFVGYAYTGWLSMFGGTWWPWRGRRRAG